MKVEIGRTSGPCTDKDVTAEFETGQLEVIKDVIAMVNAASNNKEKWYVCVDDGAIIIPAPRKCQ